ncbi:uncharacterized protein N7483_010656 [Penicillium malachiteum]|uniref:uncharacterized protein n=1 Tax=Penicillium malachiteum TaxID=1324776 RepID=UPI0025485DBC|nr:uncharacterized protein N7483_010656 [Penicillium malachiteum]KAJ5713475.1 hypothetical protein N7483_010656 [Penicillium malachiteum]
MATASIDALGAFSHLQTNLPPWITRISELATHAAARHAEYSQAYQKHTTFKPRRRKNSSVRSIHTDDLAPIAKQETPPSDAVEETTTTISTPKDEKVPAQQAGRKRGTDEAPSIDSGERHAFVSTRHNVIIEYDGHTQKVLEEVVREIGIARNNIRRGKMSLMPRGGGLRANLLNRTAGLNTQIGGVGGVGGEPSPLSSLSCVRSTRTASGVVGVTGTSTGVRKESPFDFADKQLELAHSLCETAAYQVLRSGDCATELDGVEENFKMLLEMTNSEVTRLEEEKKQREAQATEEEKENQATQPPNPTAARLARIAAITANTSKQPTAVAMGTIEVDDDSSISAESLDLSALRRSRIRV